MAPNQRFQNLKGSPRLTKPDSLVVVRTQKDNWAVKKLPSRSTPRKSHYLARVPGAAPQQRHIPDRREILMQDFQERHSASLCGGLVKSPISTSVLLLASVSLPSMLKRDALACQATEHQEEERHSK